MMELMLAEDRQEQQRDYSLNRSLVVMIIKARRV